jgi:menaquinone-specific isochorismate synthase
MLMQVLETPKQRYVYGIWNQEEGILGATPETLFHTSGKMVQTMALAGTAMKTSENRPLDLLKDAKEMKEHRLVVEDIQKQLTPLGLQHLILRMRIQNQIALQHQQHLRCQQLVQHL